MQEQAPALDIPGRALRCRLLVIPRIVSLHVVSRRRKFNRTTRREAAHYNKTTAYHTPTFSAEAQGSRGACASPFCNNSMETLSGVRRNAM